MKIEITVIPHNDQKYETTGDWRWNGDTLEISVSRLSDWRYEMLIAFHEIVEVMLCKHKKIPELAVTAFDERFEEMRKLFPEVVKLDEPGDNKNAPYYVQHQFATKLEKEFAQELGVDWDAYCDEVESLQKDA